jgi:hypothetical protein
VNPFDPRVPAGPCCEDDGRAIRAFRGDSIILDVTVKGPPPGFLSQCLTRDQLVPQNIAGWSVWFTIKLGEWDPDSAALYQATVGTGITIVQASLGQLEVKVPPATTRLLTIPRMHCDIQVKDLGANIFTVWRRVLELVDDVTFATA